MGETYRERLAVQKYQQKLLKEQAKEQAKLQAEKDFALAMNWPLLEGSEKQIAWAHSIRHKWLAWSVAKQYRVDELLQLLPQSQLEAAIRLLAKESKAADWIRLSGEYGNLKSYLQHKLDSEPRFEFELLFEDQAGAQSIAKTSAGDSMPCN
jgi:hypothetical protein